MSFEDFLKQNNCLRKYCENVREYNKDQKRLEGAANINSFYWEDTPQGRNYWSILCNLEFESGITERQTYEYFENHPCLHVKPPKCLRRL